MQKEVAIHSRITYSHGMENSKYSAIDSLEQQLKRVEVEWCFAARGGENELANELYGERGQIIHELRNVK